MIVIILISCTLILLIYHYHLHYGKRGRLINLIPGPPTFPIIGNLFLYLGSLEKLWHNQRKLNSKYYPINRTWFPHIGMVNISHPDDVEKMLSEPKHFQKGPFYDFLPAWFGDGLLISTGTKWHKRRKILTPAFHFNILQQFMDIITEETNRISKTPKDTKSIMVEDLLFFTSEHTLNVICETAMGTSLRSMGLFQQKYRRAVHDITEILTYRTTRLWLKNDTIFSLTSKGRMHNNLLKILHGFTEKIVEERKQYHEETNGKYLNNHLDNGTATKIDNEEIISVRKRRLALLDLLIAAYREKQIDDSGIKEEIDTFMFAGHDTVATATFFTLLLLAEHKDIQDRIREEINVALKENGDKFTMSSLQNMHYLERCLKECLRLYPSVPVIARRLSEDVKLSSYTVPAGTVINIYIYDVHRNPRFWPNPDAFDPDRFLFEKVRNRHPYSYIPFSAGSRNCIGQRFAMLELKSMIATILHSFYLEPIDYLKDIRLQADMVLRATQPVRMRFIPI